LIQRVLEGRNDMKLAEMKVNEFLELLASKEPAPGGGTVSALLGASGTALCSMIANLTVGKEKFKDKEPLMAEILSESQKLQDALESLIDEDTDAFNEVSKAFKMPKDTDEQKTARKAAVQQALKHATLVPFKTMEYSAAALKLFERAAGNTNPTAASDNGVGILCLKSALHGAWMNVRINLSSINDQEFFKEIDEKSKVLLNESTALADSLYERVRQQL
jgi:formiminotetrahydrofolate cyclodeaminase